MRLLKSWFTLSLLIAGLAILSASSAWAQLYRGSLTGVITDPSVAAITGVTPTVTGQGFVFNADSNGRYLVRAVPPGKYKLTFQAQRFQGEERTRQSVEAISQAAELGTQEVVTGQVVDRKFINDLPNVGPHVMSGVVRSQDGGQTGGQGNNLSRLQ